MPTPQFISASAPKSLLFSGYSVASAFGSVSLGGSVEAVAGASAFGGGAKKIPLVSAAKISIWFSTADSVVVGSIY